MDERSEDVATTRVYLALSTEPVVGQVECGNGVVVDYDAEGRAVGIERYSGPIDMPALGRVIRAAHFASTQEKGQSDG